MQVGLVIKTNQTNLIRSLLEISTSESKHPTARCSHSEFRNYSLGQAAFRRLAFSLPITSRSPYVALPLWFQVASESFKQFDLLRQFCGRKNHLKVLYWLTQEDFGRYGWIWLGYTSVMHWIDFCSARFVDTCRLALRMVWCCGGKVIILSKELLTKDEYVALLTVIRLVHYNPLAAVIRLISLNCINLWLTMFIISFTEYNPELYLLSWIIIASVSLIFKSEINIRFSQSLAWFKIL